MRVQKARKMLEFKMLMACEWTTQLHYLKLLVLAELPLLVHTSIHPEIGFVPPFI